MKPLIIGVDPGSTSAVAAVDLEGELRLLESGKNFPPRDIIQEIIEEGKPVIVASDKRKTPSKVEKIASSLGAEIYEPDEDLESGRKNELGLGDNSHEKDASASAFNAYNNMQREIRKIKELEEQLGEDRATVAQKYFSKGPVKGEDDEEEDETVEQQGRVSREPEPDREKQRMETKIENLEKQVEELKAENGELEKRNRELQSQVDEMRNEKRDEILKEREIAKREGRLREKDREIEDLERKLENARLREKQYRKALESVRKGAELVPVIDERTEEVPENALTRSEEVKRKLKSRGFNIHLVDDVKGVELRDFVAVEEFPDPRDFKDVVDEYRESR
jgi:predicted RNase H-like nuclease (RuvC/YqgF family)